MQRGKLGLIDILMFECHRLAGTDCKKLSADIRRDGTASDAPPASGLV